MLVAALSVHRKRGFFLTKGGYEYTLVLVLGLTAVSVAFTGPGALSLDALLGLGLDAPRWGLAALGTGLLGGAAALAGRRWHVPAT